MADNTVSMIVLVFVVSCSVCLLNGEGKRHEDAVPINRARRSVPIKYDIYTLDYFIELVEKIERHTITSGDSINKVVNYVRLLGYNTDLWNIVCGKADPLPDPILNSEERRVLKNMVVNSYSEQSSRREGVVLTSDRETISMGRVLLGICAGLNRDKSLSLRAWTSGAPLRVDNLFTATIAYSLGRSALYKANGDTSDLFGPSGTWSPKTECPASYSLTNTASKATDAELLGDVDGFLLGHGIPQWKKKGVRLGQLLRMYYGSGILYDTSYARCRRNSKFSSIVNKDNLLSEINGFASAYYDRNSAQLTRVNQGRILSLSKDINEKFFPHLGNIAGNSKCSIDKDSEDCEIPANVVFVMDESGSVGFNNHLKEKEFIGVILQDHSHMVSRVIVSRGDYARVECILEIIKTFDISPLQTRVAIVEYSSRASVAVALDNYGSKTRLMCAVDDISYSGGSTQTAVALETVHYYVLRPALDNPVSDTETVQIVIVLTDGYSDDRYALENAAKDLKKDIKDLTMISVGVANYDLFELRLIATDEKHHVFTAENFDKLPELVTSLRTRACNAPINMGLNFTESKDSTEVVAFVSPNKARFFTLPAELFFGVEEIFIDVVPQYGTVTVYASRITDTPGPDNYTLKIGPAGEGEEMQLQFTNLCAGYNSSETCPPINIGIYGESSSLSCSERDCNLPNQIKFKIRRGTPKKNRGGITTTDLFFRHFLLTASILVLNLL